MAITSAINFTRIANGMKSLSGGMRKMRESTGKIQQSMFNVYNVKRKNFAESKNLTAKRDEMIRIKDREEEADAASTRSKIFSRPYTALARSTKGFLGRLLDFLGSILVGWLLYNLPSIIAMVTNTVSRVFKLFNILKSFVSNLVGAFVNFGNVLGAVFKNVVSLDFFDSSKRLESAIGELTGNFDRMKQSFTDGLDLLKTPIGQAPGEEQVAPAGTDYTSGPSTAPGAPASANAGYRRVYEAARRAGDPFPEITAAQWAVESGYGRYQSGKNNPFGQKAGANEAGTYMMTTENINGRNVRVRAKFKDFASEEEAIKYRLSRFGYKYGNAKTPQEALRNLQLPGGALIPGTNQRSHGIYATDPDYIAKISRIIREQGGDPTRMRMASGAPAMGPTAATPTTALITPTQSRSGKGNGMLTPQDLVKVKNLSYAPDYRDWYGSSAMLNPVAGKAFLAAQQAYGKDIPINSAYRSVKHQQAIQGSYGVVAKPGTSRHGLGLALDLQPNTPPYDWLKKNGPKFGWFYAAIPGDPYHFEYRGGGVAPMQNLSTSQIAAAPSTSPRALAPSRQGPQINVIDNKQRDLPPLASQGGGGGGAAPMIPSSQTETLNNMVRRQMLLDLAYT